MGRREVLFSGAYAVNPDHTNYDVHPDGRRFVVLRPSEEETTLVVVLNWFEELRARMGQ